MLLRASSQTTGNNVNLTSVTNSDAESGIPHGAILIAFAEAVLVENDATLESSRGKVLKDLGAEALVDSAAVVATVMQMDRIADATGIPLDSAFVERTHEVRAELGLNSFASAQNTPQAFA